MFGFKRNTLETKSGLFYLYDGIVLDFKPAVDNPFMEEKVDEPYAFDGYVIKKSIKHLLVPKGVKGFASDFMRGVEVKEQFELPEGLLNIGDNSSDFLNGAHCVFANCTLPVVVIPDSVKELGNYAFGSTRIECLQLSESLHSPYARQFKDSYIATLKLPFAWKSGVSLKDGSLQLTGRWFDHKNYGYLRWPSTKVGKIEFY